MPATSYWYGLGLRRLAEGAVLWAGADDFRGALLTSAYVPAQDTHSHFDDLTNEVVGTGYTAGGLAFTNRSLTYDAASNELRFLADDLVWIDSTITARYLIIYNNTPAPASTPAMKWLMGYVDFGVDHSSQASNFPISFSARRVLRITAL